MADISGGDTIDLTCENELLFDMDVDDDVVLVSGLNTSTNGRRNESFLLESLTGERENNSPLSNKTVNSANKNERQIGFSFPMKKQVTVEDGDIVLTPSPLEIRRKKFPVESAKDDELVLTPGQSKISHLRGRPIEGCIPPEVGLHVEVTSQNQKESKVIVMSERRQLPVEQYQKICKGLLKPVTIEQVIQKQNGQQKPGVQYFLAPLKNIYDKSIGPSTVTANIPNGVTNKPITLTTQKNKPELGHSAAKKTNTPTTQQNKSELGPTAQPKPKNVNTSIQILQNELVKSSSAPNTPLTSSRPTGRPPSTLTSKSITPQNQSASKKSYTKTLHSPVPYNDLLSALPTRFSESQNGKSIVDPINGLINMNELKSAPVAPPETVQRTYQKNSVNSLTHNGPPLVQDGGAPTFQPKTATSSVPPNKVVSTVVDLTCDEGRNETLQVTPTIQAQPQSRNVPTILFRSGFRTTASSNSPETETQGGSNAVPPLTPTLPTAATVSKPLLRNPCTGEIIKNRYLQKQYNDTVETFPTAEFFEKSPITPQSNEDSSGKKEGFFYVLGPVEQTGNLVPTLQNNIAMDKVIENSTAITPKCNEGQQSGVFYLVGPIEGNSTGSSTGNMIVSSLQKQFNNVETRPVAKVIENSTKVSPKYNESHEEDAFYVVDPKEHNKRKSVLVTRIQKPFNSVKTTPVAKENSTEVAPKSNRSDEEGVFHRGDPIVNKSTVAPKILNQFINIGKTTAVGKVIEKSTAVTPKSTGRHKDLFYPADPRENRTKPMLATNLQKQFKNATPVTNSTSTTLKPNGSRKESAICLPDPIDNRPKPMLATGLQKQFKNIVKTTQVIESSTSATPKPNGSRKEGVFCLPDPIDNRPKPMLATGLQKQFKNIVKTTPVTKVIENSTSATPKPNGSRKEGAFRVPDPIDNRPVSTGNSAKIRFIQIPKQVPTNGGTKPVVDTTPKPTPTFIPVDINQIINQGKKAPIEGRCRSKLLDHSGYRFRGFRTEERKKPFCRRILNSAINKYEKDIETLKQRVKEFDESHFVQCGPASSYYLPEVDDDDTVVLDTEDEPEVLPTISEVLLQMSSMAKTSVRPQKSQKDLALELIKKGLEMIQNLSMEENTEAANLKTQKKRKTDSTSSLTPILSKQKKTDEKSKPILYMQKNIRKPENTNTPTKQKMIEIKPISNIPKLRSKLREENADVLLHNRKRGRPRKNTEIESSRKRPVIQNRYSTNKPTVSAVNSKRAPKNDISDDSELMVLKKVTILNNNKKTVKTKKQ